MPILNAEAVLSEFRGLRAEYQQAVDSSDQQMVAIDAAHDAEATAAIGRSQQARTASEAVLTRIDNAREEASVALFRVRRELPAPVAVVEVNGDAAEALPSAAARTEQALDQLLLATAALEQQRRAKDVVRGIIAIVAIGGGIALVLSARGPQAAILVSPLIAGAVLVLCQVETFATWTALALRRLGGLRDQRGSDGLSQVGRAIGSGFGWVERATAPISDIHLQTGTRVAATMYAGGVIAGIGVGAVWLAVVLVVTIAVIAIVIWLIIALLESK